MKTALITGVSGYLGSHLAKALKKFGWKVVGIDKRYPKNNYVDLFQVGDIVEQEIVNNTFRKVKIDTVFHLAGRIEVCESNKNPTEFYRNNVNGTINVLNAMKIFGVNKVIYSSTAGVYETKGLPLRETDRLNPTNNAYAGSKYCAELAIQQSGLNYVIFRYFNLAGADPDGEFGECHEPETHLIPRILQNLNTFEIYGNDYSTQDGTCVRDYVHVSDVANAHVDAAQYLQDGKESQILNLGTGKGYSVKEIIDLIGEITKRPVGYTYRPRREGDPAQLIANINLAEELLTYSPKHDIVSIIKTAYEWQKRHDGKE
jgi:UDP-glucose 4-epimerase